MPVSSDDAKRKNHALEQGSAKSIPGKYESKSVDRSLHYSNIEGAFSNASGSITGSYTTPLALSLHATNSEIGIINSLQNLASTFAQLPGARLSAWLGSRKRAWFFSSIMQRVFWVPIILLPVISVGNPILMLMIFLMLVSFFAALRGPAWSSLMGDIVPKSRWGKYFGWRNTVVSIAGLLAILASGQLLIWFGFPLLLTVALVLGIASIFFFAKMYEPPFRREYHYTHSISLKPGNWLSSMKLNRNFTCFTIFMAAMSFAVNIASPFFSVYMLVDMKLSYAWYAALIVIESLVIIASQPYWGRLCDRYGDRRVMIITGILICFVPFFWLFVSSPYHIIIANVLSGFAWAGFGIATFNFMLAASPAGKRAEFTANYSFFTGLAVVAGALAGGLMAWLAQDSVILFFAGLQVVFFASFLLRLASLVFVPFLRESRVKEDKEPMNEIFWRTVAVNPIRGIVHAVMHPDYNGWIDDASGFFRSIRNKLVYKIRIRRNR